MAMTKRSGFSAILSILNANEFDFEDPDITTEALKDMIGHEIEGLDARAEKAKERSAARKAASDDLCERVYGVLSSDPMTIAQIADALNDPDLTTQMITPRLTRLVNEGRAERTSVTVGEDSKKKNKAYTRI